MSATDYKTISRQVLREIREGTPFQQSLPEVSNNYSSDFYGINEGEDIDYEALADFIFDCEKIGLTPLHRRGEIFNLRS